METPTTVNRELRRPIAGQLDNARLRNWDDYPLMLNPLCIMKITGWSRTFTYEQLRPYGRLAGLAQRWGRRVYVSRDALRNLLEREAVQS